MTLRTTFLTSSLALLALSPGLVWGVEETTELTPGPAQLSLEDLRTFTDAFNQIRRNYVEEIDDQTLLNAAIRGMLSELDPHSNFFLPRAYTDLDNESQGRYGGIGVEVRFFERKIEVINVTPGGPADTVDIEPGDFITAVNGEEVRARDLRGSMDQLQGEPGTKVTVERSRGGDRAEFELTRALVPMPSVAAGLTDEHYGYFRVSHFHQGTADELHAEIDRITEEHGGPLYGIILDLRGNPGGVLTPAVEMADGFLDEGLIVRTEGRYQAAQLEYHAQPGQWANAVPLIVLMDGGSASASEVLAGALQDHGRALVVGETSYGKGSVQSVLTMRNGSGMKLTTARYLTPSGRSIQAQGIVPDIEVLPVEFVEDKRQRRKEADLDGHLANTGEDGAEGGTSEVDPREDYVLSQALGLLKGAQALAAPRAPQASSEEM